MNVTHGGGHRELAATLTREGVLKSWSWAHLQNSVGVLQIVTWAFIVSEVCDFVVPELLLVARFGVAQSTWGFLLLDMHYW